jgi:hypothetical protein
MKFNYHYPNITFILAILFANQLHAAPAINLDNQPFGYIGQAELSELNDIGKKGAKAYLGWFENGAWQGDLIEYTVGKDGTLATSIQTQSGIPTQSQNGKNWSANIQFIANQNGSSHWDLGRKIITSTNGTNQVAFRFNKLSPTQQQALLANATPAEQEKLLNFIRGDRSQEIPKGALRARFSVLGDIIHSNPTYVAAPNATTKADYAKQSYVTFKNNNKNRPPRIYVGANDGMLHAFDALTGNEVWAYIPSMLIAKLSTLAIPSYQHRYFVDGTIAVRDVFINNNWQSVLVSGMGSGGKGLFALNVTDPNLSSETSSGGNNQKLIWEINSSNNDIGYIFGAISAAKLNDGKWYAVFGNGVNSSNGVAKLLLKEIGGNNLITISTNSGSPLDRNGLSAPTLVDINEDGMVDLAFAGDLNGDMWRFNLEGSLSTSWNIDYKLYDGSPTQPITTTPDVTQHSESGYMVLFGTGKLYQIEDMNNNTIQSIYGIRDTGTQPAISKLKTKKLSAASSHTFVRKKDGLSQKHLVRTLEVDNDGIDFDVFNGWKINLTPGERALTPPRIRDARLKIMLTQPQKMQNWLLEAPIEGNLETNKTIFDLNGDTELDDQDKIDGNGDGDTLDYEDVPVSLQSKSGVTAQLTIGSLESGSDIQFSAYINPNEPAPKPMEPPIPIGCNELNGNVCRQLDPTGISHIDVDTDTPINGLGGSTDAHIHEYDVANNIDHVDYTNLKSTELTKVNAAISPDQLFIVLIANADLSPGAYITIGNNGYSAAYYQKMIHQALAEWDGEGDLLDPNGKSLIHSLNSINAVKGTLKTTFDQGVLQQGGIIPTETGCMKDNTYAAETGRQRSGSLTIHLVKRETFNNLQNGTKALSKVIVQNPKDLIPLVKPANRAWVSLSEKIKGKRVNYAGLLAASNDSFLYESTIFWHWDGSCYGSPDWMNQYDATFKKSHYYGSIAELSLNQTLEQKEQLILQSPAYLNPVNFAPVNDNNTVPPPISNFIAPPAACEKGDDCNNMTPGLISPATTTKTGRRSWIDLIPDR